MLEVRAVVDARGEHHHGGLAGGVRCRCPQRGEQPVRVLVHRADPVGGEALREHGRHGLPVGHDVAHPGRDPHVVLEDPEGSPLVTDQVDARHVDPHVVGRAEPVGDPEEPGRRRDHPPRHDPGPHRLTLSVDVGQERLQHPDPLRHTGFNLRPLVGRDHPRHDIDRERPLLAGEVERHPLVEVGAGQHLSTPTEIPARQGAEGGMHRTVGTSWLLVIGKHLVPRRIDAVAIEELRHGAKASRVHVTSTLRSRPTHRGRQHVASPR